MTSAGFKRYDIALATGWKGIREDASRNIASAISHNPSAISQIVLGQEGNIAITSLWDHAPEQGFIFHHNGKNFFIDGHEREDVVAYRQEWTGRMIGYRSLMAYFNEGNEEEAEQPIFSSNEVEFVFVTDDESTFYANGCNRNMWLEEGERPLGKQNPEFSIIISEFRHACHGNTWDKGWSSESKFLGSANCEHCWTSQDLLKQHVEVTFTLLQVLHYDCKALFLFDQRSNRGVYGKAALVANRLLLKNKLASTK